VRCGTSARRAGPSLRRALRRGSCWRPSRYYAAGLRLGWQVLVDLEGNPPLHLSSRSWRERDDVLLGELGGVAHRRLDVRAGERRVALQDLLDAAACGEVLEDDRDRDARATNACLPVADIRAASDPGAPVHGGIMRALRRLRQTGAQASPEPSSIRRRES